MTKIGVLTLETGYVYPLAMAITSGGTEAPKVTPQGAAAILGVSAAAVSDWADRGYLPVFRTPSGQRRFRESDVRALLAQMADEKTDDKAAS